MVFNLDCIQIVYCIPQYLCIENIVIMFERNKNIFT